MNCSTGYRSFIGCYVYILVGRFVFADVVYGVWALRSAFGVGQIDRIVLKSADTY